MLKIAESDKQAALHNRWVIEDYLQDAIKFNSKIRDILLISAKGIILGTSGKGIIADYNFQKREWFPETKDSFNTTYTVMHPQDYYYESYGRSKKQYPQFQQYARISVQTIILKHR